MRTLRDTVAPLQQRPQELLQVLCEVIDVHSLYAISEADYGIRSSEYARELIRVKRLGAIPAMNFDKALAEVLHLTRWGQPDESDDDYLTTPQRNNLRIAFACTVLLTVPTTDYVNRMGEASTIIRLVQTCGYLRHVVPDIRSLAIQLLAWRITNNATEPEDLPFFILGLILTLLEQQECQEEEIGELIDHLMEEEERAFAMDGPETGRPQWLFRVAFFNPLQDDWQAYAPYLLKEANRMQRGPVKSKLQRLAELLG